jgi:hypothetical protein
VRRAWLRGGGGEACGAGGLTQDGAIKGLPMAMAELSLNGMAEGRLQNWGSLWRESRLGRVGWLDNSQAEPGTR